MAKINRYRKLIIISLAFILFSLIIARLGALYTRLNIIGIFGLIAGVATILALAIAVVEFSVNRSKMKNNVEFVQHDTNTDFTSQGFRRLSDLLSGEITLTRDPIEYWRVGFDFPAVVNDIPVERQVYEGEEISKKVTVDVISSLFKFSETSDTGLAITGPPGSGKSTICKQVAEQWYDQQGPVLYRESRGGEREFEDLSPVRDAIDGITGDLLVVVEDAPNTDADLVFELINHYQHNPAVTFLLDARQSDWDQIDYHLTDPNRIDAHDKIISYPLSPPNLQEYRRIVGYFEETISPTNVSGEDLHSEFKTNSGIGEMYLIGNTLATVAREPIVDTDFESTPLMFQSEIQSIIAQFHRENRSDLVERVAIMANVLNLSRFPLSNDLFHAVDNNGKYDVQIDKILKDIEGKFIFEGESDRYANHTLWSARYLELLLQTESTARIVSLFEDCINAIFRLHDDPELRNRIETYLVEDSNTQYIRRIQNDSTKSEDAVSRIFEIGRQHRTLADLFGTTESSSIQLPEPCDTHTKLLSTYWRAEMFEDAGRYQESATEYEYLVGKAAEYPLSAQQNRWWRSLGLQRLAFTELRQGNYESAERYARRAFRISAVTDDLQQIGDSQHMIGYILVESGQFDDSQLYLDAALDCFRSLDRPTFAARTLGVRGLSAWKRGSIRSEDQEYVAAEKYFSKSEIDHQESLDLYNDSENRLGIARQLNNIALIHWERGKLLQNCPAPSSLIKHQFDNAKNNLNRAMELNKRYGNKQDLARNYGNLGLICRDSGDLKTALEFHRKSRDIEIELGNERNAAISTHNIAIIHKRENEIKEACKLIDEAANTFVRIKAWYDAYRAIKFAVECYEELGDDIATAEWNYLGMQVADAVDNDDWRSDFDE